MNVNAFTELIKSEEKAKKYLLQFCWKNHQRFCPRCNSRKLYRLREGRRRCSRCGYTFHDFSARFINTGKLSCVQWLWLLKLYELDAPLKIMATQLDLTYNTVHKVMGAIRRSILCNALDASMYLNLGFMNADGPPFTPVFGVMERGGWVFVDLAPDLTPEAVAHFRANFHMRTRTRGRLVYTDRYRHYDCLLFHAASEEILHPFMKGSGEDLLIDSKSGFWPYLLQRVQSSRGLSPKWFPFVLKDLEFRYNHRQEDIIGLVAAFLCAFVPKGE